MVVDDIQATLYGKEEAVRARREEDRHRPVFIKGCNSMIMDGPLVNCSQEGCLREGPGQLCEEASAQRLNNNNNSNQ